MRTEVILLALLVILGLQNTIKPIGIDAKGVLECENKKADIAFIIDPSDSDFWKDFDKGIDFLQSFVKNFKIGPDNVRIAAVSFGEKMITDLAFEFDQHNDKDAVLHALKNIIFKPELRGSTNTATAISYAREHFFNNARPNVNKLAIVLTNGESDDFRKTKAEADLLKSQGVHIIVIGIGNTVREEELKAIATYDEDVFKVDSYRALKDITHTFGLITCKFITDWAVVMGERFAQVFTHPLSSPKRIEIFIVNMGSLNHESVLESMASGKSTHILRAADSGEMIEMARSLVAQICKKKTEPDG